MRKYLDVWVRVFCDTNLVAAEASGLGLCVRRAFEDGGVVVTGFLDAQAPATPVSETEDGVPTVGLFALLNASCANHANVRFRSARNGDTAAAVALKPIREGENILGLYGDCR